MSLLFLRNINYLLGPISIQTKNRLRMK